MRKAVRRRPLARPVGYYKRCGAFGEPSVTRGERFATLRSVRASFIASGTPRTEFHSRLRSPVVRSRRMKNFINTALPRVGVARPNGSYVARTQVLAARATLVRRRTLADCTSRLPNINSTDTSDGEGEIPGGVSLAAYLYAVAKFSTVLSNAPVTCFLDVSASHRRSSVRD